MFLDLRLWVWRLGLDSRDNQIIKEVKMVKEAWPGDVFEFNIVDWEAGPG